MTEQGLTIVRPTLAERLSYRLLANKLGLAVMMSAGIVTGIDIKKEVIDRTKLTLDSAQGVLKIDRDFRKGKIKGNITRTDLHSARQSESPIRELAEYSRGR